jgi:drug/metabolite transporter (DMT)-like permease
MQSKSAGQGVAQLSLAMVISGTIGLFVVESGQSAINAVFFRCLIGGAILLSYILYNDMLKKHYFSRRNCICLLLIGLSIVTNWVALFNAYSHISIGLATTIYHVQPFLVFFGGTLFLGERLSKHRLFYICLAFIGVLMIVNPFGQDDNADYLLGCGLALFAAFFYAVATITTKKMDKIPPHIVASSQMVMGIVLLFPFVDFANLPSNDTQWSLIFGLGILHSAIMYIMIYSAYQKLPTSKIAVLGYIYPLVAVAVDYVYFDHVLTVYQVIGGCLIIVCGLLGVLNTNPFSRKPDVASV